MMIVWQMEGVDENQDLGLFGSVETAKRHYDALHSTDTPTDVPIMWMQWDSDTWKGSINGEVEVVLYRRRVITAN
jgi:hypothetical protein